MAPFAVLRSCNAASTSAPAHARRSASSRVRCVRVFASAEDLELCRDKIVLNTPKNIETKGLTHKITFVGAGGERRTIDCPDNQYILSAAERGGLDLPATCRGGICGACVVRVLSGTVDQSDIADLSFCIDEDEQKDGMALLCMTRATSDVVCETQSDWGYSLGVADWKGATGKFSSKPNPLVGVSWTELKKEQD